MKSPEAQQRMKSKVLRAAATAAASLETRKWPAPKERASASLAAEVEMAHVSQPMARAYCRPMWPRPPMPTTPTRMPALAWRASGAKVVMPAQSSGPTCGSGRPAGILKANLALTVMLVA